MDHRLSTILKYLAQQSLAQIDAATTTSKPVQTDEEFYERRRTLALNDFNNRDLIQINKEAKYTMAMNDIEPIPNIKIPYGAKEPFQEVKAHLISPYSCRTSAESRSWEDNQISDRGTTPLVDSSGPDKVSHTLDILSELTEYEKKKTRYKEVEGILYIGSKSLYEIVESELKIRLPELRTKFLKEINSVSARLLPAGLYLTSGLREMLLLKIIMKSIVEICNATISYKDLPNKLINLFEVGIENVGEEGREFPFIKSHGAWELCDDLQEIIWKDKDMRFYLIPLSSKLLVRLYSIIRNSCLDLLYPQYYHTNLSN